MCGGLRSPSGLCSSQGVAQRLILLRCNLPGPRKSDDSKSWAVLHRSPYLGAVHAEHVGPAARSLRFALLEPSGLGARLSVRRANVRSRSEIRKITSEGTKQGGNNHQTAILGLVRPTAHGLSRADFPPPLTLSCCGTYLQGGNGVDVQGDSAARDELDDPESDQERDPIGVLCERYEINLRRFAAETAEGRMRFCGSVEDAMDLEGDDLRAEHLSRLSAQ